jgi:fumarylpyruvate hydrolase
VYCVGKNYADHVKEMGGDIARSTPVFFMKPNDGVVFAGSTTTTNPSSTTPINYPPSTNNLHYEVELVVAIGKDQETTTTTTSHIDPKDAEQYIYGYAVGIDLTRRDLQNDAKERRGPWDVAKYFDQSAPISSISTNLSLKQIENDTTTIQLKVNGTIRQSAKINQMIWNISEIISELSKSFTLRQGDLIMTGTPAGVGPINIGDRVVGTIDGLESVDMILTSGRETKSLKSKTTSTHSPITSQKRYIHTIQVSKFSTSSKKDKQNDDIADADSSNSNNNSNTIMGDHPPQTAWKQLQSLPNIITLTRMAATPILCYWIVQENYNMALYGCLFAAISDGLDGYFAKHHGMNTVLGTYLDPIADKVLVNGLAISLWYTGILPTPLVALWATKDFVLLGGTAWYLYKEQNTINFFDMSIATKPLTVTPTTLGKANTGLQFATLALGIISPVVTTTLPPSLLPSLCLLTGITTVGSVLSYTGQAGIKMTEQQQKDRDDNDSVSTSHKEDTSKR